MSDEITSQGPERSGINRRTVMKGAAWSVPVIVVASAAPAIAQSGPVEFTGTACRHTGASDGNHVKQDYHFELQVIVPPGPCVNVSIDHVRIGGNVAANDKPFCIGAQCPSSTGGVLGPINLGCVASPGQVFVLHVDSDSSANTTVDVGYTYGGVSDNTAGVTGESPCAFTPKDY